MTSFLSTSLSLATDYWWVLLLVADTIACIYLAHARKGHPWALVYLTALVIGSLFVLIGTVGAQFASDPNAYWGDLRTLQDFLGGYASDERDGTFWNIFRTVFSYVSAMLSIAIVFLGGWDFLAFADRHTQPTQKEPRH